MKVLMVLRRKIYYVFEQPAQSWAFKLPEMKELIKEFSMRRGKQVANIGKYCEILRDIASICEYDTT